MRKIYHLFLFALQFCFYYLITPLAYLIYKNKYPWIICERGDDARDNGYTMFKYLRTEQQYINAYYLINRKSPDYEKVKKIGNVVKYKSLKHWLLYRVAECRMSTHMLAGPGNYINEWFKHHKHKGINVFLQHGITHNEFPSNHYKYNGSDLFICGAKPEYDHISKNCHYPNGNVVYTGFSRFDELHDVELKNQILIMPTWRSYLKGLSKEDFKKTDYYKYWDLVLHDQSIKEILSNSGLKIIFYLHPSLKEYVDCFSNNNEVIIAEPTQYDIQTLLKESKLLITDYSSVFFDFAYMRKPIIYYQFDKNAFYEKHYKRSYFNHIEDGFGDVTSTIDELQASIIKVINNSFKVQKQYLSRSEQFFPMYDMNNSKRIFDAIIDKLISSKAPQKTKTKPTYILITGDDYGRVVDSCKGIDEALKKGYITQTSLMVNRGQIEKEHITWFPKDKIVYHFNITEGLQSFGDTSLYAYSVNKNTIAKRVSSKSAFFKLSKDDKNTIKKELECQIKTFRGLGYKCISFDSHGHTHTKYPMAKIIIPILKKNGFVVARIPQNIKYNHLFFDLIYRSFVINLYRRNFITADYFCSCYNFIHLNLNKYTNKSIEIMTHPTIDDKGFRNRNDIDFNLIKKFLTMFNTELIDYNELIRIKSK